MAAKQTRRCVSLRGDVYTALRAHCEELGRPMSSLVQSLVEKYLDRKTAISALQAPPAPVYNDTAPPAPTPPARHLRLVEEKEPPAPAVNTAGGIFTF